MARVRGAGASYVRLILYWRDVEKKDSTGHIYYDWSRFDPHVQNARSAGLEPMVTIMKAPSWAENRKSFGGEAGTVDPSPAAFGKFAGLAAARYKGKVTHWEAWNEPNLTHFLGPQWVNGAWYMTGHYRLMVNAFADAVHGVDPANVVIAGSTGPFGRVTKTYRNPAPLTFMRRVLCLSSTNRPIAGCGPKVKFDAWSTHPYTEGGPFHSAAAANNVSLGDLPDMRRVLKAGLRYGRISSSRPVEFWVGEFGWDSYMPDPKGVGIRLHARWTSEALYQAWRSGVSTFIWHQLNDRPFPATAYQAGLYYCGVKSLSDEKTCMKKFSLDVAKPALNAFRFPFVAYAGSGRNRVWGRTPTGKSATVVIQRKVSSRWVNWRSVKASSVGVFSGSWASSKKRGYLRAKLVGTTTKSTAFSLVRPRDRYVYPWGTR